MHKGNWLFDFQKNYFSQAGEDGILEEIFKILKVQKGWCVELGAWDGKLYSNTYHLIQSQKWSSVLIEGDKKRFLDLKKTYGNCPDAHLFCSFVGFDSKNNLGKILAQTPIPKDFDLLSIDIDGNDIHLWEALEGYHPKVVVIEYNPTIPNHVDFVQPKDMKLSQGNSLRALIRLGKEKGYELIATTFLNGIFVKKELYPLFQIEDNAIDLMRLRSPEETTFFQLYDGTVVLQGNKHLIWSGLKIRKRKFQVLPKFLRYYTTKNPFKRFFRKCWHFLN